MFGLNYDNPDLHGIMPWCGTHDRAGPESIVQTFVDVGRYWTVVSFEVEAVFGSGEHAAMFGRFSYRSTAMSKVVNSPFTVFAKVKDGRCHYLQFMEDTPPARRSAAEMCGHSAAIPRAGKSLFSGPQIRQARSRSAGGAFDGAIDHAAAFRLAVWRQARPTPHPAPGRDEARPERARNATANQAPMGTAPLRSCG
jgi:hypothetical protein